jgi:hypothetical protein
MNCGRLLKIAQFHIAAHKKIPVREPDEVNGQNNQTDPLPTFRVMALSVGDAAM